MSPLTPVTPLRRARITWSRIGSRKASVLPEPVPVVTRVGRGRPSAELRRVKALAWCQYGVKFSGIHSSSSAEYLGAGAKGIRVRR